MKNRGFTLLEILIALFIFAIVSIMVVTALHNILNNQARVEQRSKSFSELQFAFLLLSHDLEQSINRPILDMHGQQQAAFLGNAQSVTLTHAGFNNPFNQLSRSTLQRTRYRFEQNSLIRETWIVLDQAPHSQPVQRILLNDITDLRFSYFDQQGRFQKQWPPPDDNQKDKKQQAQPLPRAIQVSFTLKKWGKISQIYLIPIQMPEQQQNDQKPPENENK